MKRVKKWLIYDVAVILTGAVAALILNDHICVDVYSLVPAGTAIALWLLALGARKFENWEASLISFKFSKRDGQKNIQFKSPSAFDTTWDKIEEFFYLVAAPWPIPFIFLFDHSTKLTASGIFFGLPLLFPLLTLPIHIKFVLDAKREFEQEKAQMERELKEQQRREEMGEWK